MGAAWVDHPSWEVVHDASEAAERDVARLLLEADDDELKQTRNAQLATFTLSMVVLDAVERLGLEPVALAGHSLGEYSALVASGALSFDDGVRIVVERGEAMQAAAEERPGTMAAVLGADADAVDAACRRAEDDVWLANDNAPGQVVIAGSSEAIAVAGELAKGAGARKVMALPVGGAFHSPYMEGARRRLRKAIAEARFRDPEVPVVANVDARTHPEAEAWPGLLSTQLCSPVRWRQTMLVLADLGTTRVVELGPGGVLTGLARRTVPGVEATSVTSPDDLDALMTSIAGDPLQRWAAGHQGEHLYVHERLVVSPAAGVFEPAEAGTTAAAEGELVDVGALVGTVGSSEVRTPFAGWLMGCLVLPGERVAAGQPVAWLRAR